MIKKYEIGTLILRLVLGFSFFTYGLVKFRDGIENTVGWFESIVFQGLWPTE
jgi:putative oxidoreductase